MSKETAAVWTQVGLTEAEYQRVVAILGREPNYVELQMFGVMWSEHCSYKHSRAALRQLPTKGPRVLQGPGENAGVIDLGDGLGLAFKVESHNHPTFVEPFQGAATGVGGILRDVFTMGARPIAILDSLRFGELSDPKQRHLFAGAVSGIGFYGNCMGIPNVGGEVYFEDSYKGNCLVNAMCAGLVKADGIKKGIAQGVGNPIMVVGARTGRDGIHGASLLASAEFSEASAESRPRVQVGDPFMEKLLLEACLELFQTDAVVGIQDMGAAGLISSSSEMAAKGDVGIEMDVQKVPARETGMQAWEFLLSESQERMLVCVAKGREAEVERIFKKWDLESAVIGVVTDDGMMRIKDGDQVVAEVPAQALADAPVYHPEKREPGYLAQLRAFDWSTVREPEPEEYGDILLQLLGSPNLCSREWITRQYDHQVLLNTVVEPGYDSGLLRIPGTTRGVALKLDCNGRYVYLNPRRGTAIAVAEAARNIAVTGAEPVAITNNLNFGNPEKPEIFWQFDAAVQGMAEACNALGTPVTGGNVSFYNETNGEAIFPTPTIGMVGIHPDVTKAVPGGFQTPDEVIVLLGETKPELGGSEYAKVIHGVVAGDAPELNLEHEAKLIKCLQEGAREGIFTAAHDVAEGGLLVALAEMAIKGKEGARGCQANIFAGDGRLDGYLLGESQGRVLVTVGRDNVLRLRGLCISHGVPHRLIGDVQNESFKVAVLAQGTEMGIFRRQEVIDLTIDQLAKPWREGLPCVME